MTLMTVLRDSSHSQHMKYGTAFFNAFWELLNTLIVFETLRSSTCYRYLQYSIFLVSTYVYFLFEGVFVLQDVLMVVI